MTRRFDLERHRQSLAEIREIMNSMKTLAYMETRKLARFLDAQQSVVTSIEAAATDFLASHADLLPTAQDFRPVYLLIGTERGFCGDYNHVLLRQLEASLTESPQNMPILIAIGRKLHTLLEHDARVIAFINGASVAEEVSAVLYQIVNTLMEMQDKHGILGVHCLSHSDKGGVMQTKLMPPFQQLSIKPARMPQNPPILNLTPREFLLELTEHYLFAALHQLLYTSLETENHQRMTHLEGAVKHLDEDADKLTRQCNALRQEEIIEEIEVILLSASNMDKRPDRV